MQYYTIFALLLVLFSSVPFCRMVWRKLLFTKISCPLSLVGIPCGKECHGNTTSAWHEKLTAELLDSRGGASVYPLGSGARGKMSSPGTARDGKIETTKGRTGKTGTKRREKGTDNT